ncbi:ABC transporter substrate-binding protein [Neobacillus drentensis]|uniref:ABC transporter substrate-binding protein n=1 Tax=Neobacillus drentensis TaxID=220684 RepID=UPI001F3766B9|nr:ABC transporter substrate-binding protein [Neobacillus drentensis]ULT56133.1 ABC transporter substrate-binding protein [Neobacillus drentensis]
MKKLTKKWTKPVSLVTSALLFLSLAACSSNQSTQTSSKSSTSTKDNLSKHVTISYASVQGIDGYDYTKGDPLAKYYSDKFNYTLKVSSLNWDNWSSNLRIWINSGDMPDVAVYNFIYADAASFVKQGLLKKLPDDWKTRWPHLAAVYEKTSLGPEMEKKLGGTYFLPRARFMNNLPGDPLPNHPTVYIRADWAKAVGFPVKDSYTTSEILQYAKLIKDKDPGKIGDKLVPLSEDTNFAADLFVGRNSTHYQEFYKDTDGKYKWGAASPDTLKGLKQLQEAYRSGLLSKDFYTNKNQTFFNDFNVTGTAGASFNQAPTSNLQTVYNDFNKNIKKDPYENIHMATVLGDDGKYHQTDLINFWGTIIFNPNISEEKFVRYMDILDYNSTKEGEIINMMGLKDVDWTYDSNGKVKSLYDPAKEGKALGGPGGKYQSWGYLLGSTVLFDDTSFEDPNIDQRLRDRSKELYASRVKEGTPETFSKVNWDLYTYDSPSYRRAQFQYNQEYVNLITQPGDIEKNWKKWVKSKNAVVQPILDELNSKLAK